MPAHPSANSKITQDRWNTLSYVIQMANAGGEVERMIKRRENGELERSSEHLLGALELLEFTRNDPKNVVLLGELYRVIESIKDAYQDGNHSGKSTDEQWRSYFMSFCWAAAVERGFVHE